ncbi:hypothetical protein BY996DRAFT_8391542 [Phakopsora pachyrhizi]|nr:hypothetical protein BY996DRAFT_8391542 [Phakopsora pachyrhizi]
MELLSEKSRRNLELELVIWSSEDEGKESSQVMQLEGFPKCKGFFNGTTIPLSQNPALNGNVYFDCKRRIRDPLTGGFVGKRNGLLLDQALLYAIKMERLKKENKYLRELLGISGDFDHQNGSSNESSLLRTRGRDRNGVGGAEGARDDEQELHLAKLNSVVSEVIKEEEEEEEEEEEDDNDNEHLEEQHEGPYYVEEEDNIKAWQTAPCEFDQDEHGEISNKHGDVNDQTHLDQDLSPLSSSHDPNFENNQPKGKNQSDSTNSTITLTLP